MGHESTQLYDIPVSGSLYTPLEIQIEQKAFIGSLFLYVHEVKSNRICD